MSERSEAPVASHRPRRQRSECIRTLIVIRMPDGAMG